VLTFWLLVALPLCLGFLPLLQLNSSVNHELSVWLADDDPVWQNYESMRESFGLTETLYVGVTSKELMKESEKEAWESEWKTLLNEHSFETDLQPVSPHFLNQVSFKNQTLAEYKKEKGSRYRSLWRLDFEGGERPATRAYDLSQAFENHWDEKVMNRDQSFLIVGASKITKVFEKLIASDLQVLLPLIFIFIAVLCFVTLRSFYLSALMMLIQTLGLSAVLLVYTSVGLEFNLITLMILPLMVAVSLADGLYYIHHVRGTICVSEEERKQKFLEKTAELWPSCFRTTVTTVIGFMSLCLHESLPVRHLGIFVSLGSVLVLLISFSVLPAGISLMKSVKCSPVVPDKFFIVLFQRLSSLGKTLGKKGVYFFGLSVLLVMVFISLKIHIDTDFLDFLPDDLPAKKEVAEFEKSFGSLAKIDLVVKPRFSGSAWRDLDDLTKTIEIFGVKSVWSATSWLRETGFFLAGTSEINFSSRNEVNQLLFLARSVQPERFLQLMTNSEDKFRLEIYDQWQSNSSILDKVIHIDALIESGDRWDHYFTGPVMTWLRIDETLFQNFLKSLVTVMAAMLFLFFYFYRSLVLAAAGVLVNFMPVLVSLIILVLLDKSLSMATVTIAPLLVGVSVDNTIHFIDQAKRLHSKDDFSLKNLIPQVAFPFFFTQIILSLGLSVLFFSSLPIIQTFALIFISSVLINLIIEAVFLPLVANHCFKHRHLRGGGGLHD
jgi:predicted RND superfamily exporter protein